MVFSPKSQKYDRNCDGADHVHPVGGRSSSPFIKPAARPRSLACLKRMQERERLAALVGGFAFRTGSLVPGYIGRFLRLGYSEFRESLLPPLLIVVFERSIKCVKCLSSGSYAMQNIR